MKPDIKAIEARAAAATPGPWEASKDGWTAWAGNVKIADYLDPDNAEFIAHARTDIPRLLDYIKELEAQLAESKADYEAAVEDLKKNRKHKCDCCCYRVNGKLYAPCRDCQSPISNMGDMWTYRGRQGK